MINESLRNDNDSGFANVFGQQEWVRRNEDKGMGDEGTGQLSKEDATVKTNKDPKYEFKSDDKGNFHSEDSEASQGKRKKFKSM